MALDAVIMIGVIDTMESYIAAHRPKPEIRHQLDLSYELEDQSVILTEIRPAWNKPDERKASGYAKATYVKAKNVWKIYWMRANAKWHVYDPAPTVQSLAAFLKIVDEDKFHCFKG